ncbi:MAG: protein-glutamate O-methyltransferase CheR [Calditrichia bacterium]
MEVITNYVEIRDEEYRLIRDLVYSRFGISLGNDKKTLVVGRLSKILRSHQYQSFEQFYQYVINDRSGKALSLLIDHISTNHTYFFREDDHFKYFREIVLPQLAQRAREIGRLDIRIWCAGCSSGEEAYTLAMLTKEYFQNEGGNWELGLLATDISSNALEKAQTGIYATENIERIPTDLKRKYFRKLPDGRWQVNDSLKQMILFRRLNLMRPSFPFKGKFPVIFCRNVMIYFDEMTRDALVKRFHNYTEPNGYLFIGHSETLRNYDIPYHYVQPAVYRRN